MSFLSNSFLPGKKALISLLALVCLTACSNRAVVSKDNSIEYKTAQELPPLKKPGAELQLPYESDKGGNAGENTQGIQASVETTRAGVAQLRIESDLDSAWEFVSNHLRKSGITVHARNRQANRFDIACEENQQVNKKSSRRWSIFRRKSEQLEYCAIQLRRQGRVSIARIINRQRNDFAEADANALFTRLLNN